MEYIQISQTSFVHKINLSYPIFINHRIEHDRNNAVNWVKYQNVLAAVNWAWSILFQVETFGSTVEIHKPDQWPDLSPIRICNIHLIAIFTGNAEYVIR